MARLVADLRSQDTAARRIAFARLKEETCVDRINHLPPYDPGRAPDRQAAAIEDWERYLRGLHYVVQEGVPLLMQKGGDDEKRASVAYRVGVGAPHRVFLPLLREIIANKEETLHVRYRALRGLALIPHDGLMEYLLAQTDEVDVGWKSYAWELIRRLTGQLPKGVQPGRKGPADWQRAKAAFLEWWAANKKDFKYERGKVRSM